MFVLNSPTDNQDPVGLYVVDEWTCGKEDSSSYKAIEDAMQEVQDFLKEGKKGHGKEFRECCSITRVDKDRLARSAKKNVSDMHIHCDDPYSRCHQAHAYAKTPGDQIWLCPTAFNNDEQLSLKCIVMHELLHAVFGWEDKEIAKKIKCFDPTCR